MFDWPAQRKTSPTSTSLARLVSPFAVAVSVYGPPAVIAGRVARQCPSESARASALTRSKRHRHGGAWVAFP